MIATERPNASAIVASAIVPPKLALRKVDSPERGATLVEYGLLVALLAVIAVVSLRVIGTSARQRFISIADAVDDNGIACEPPEICI